VAGVKNPSFNRGSQLDRATDLPWVVFIIAEFVGALALHVPDTDVGEHVGRRMCDAMISKRPLKNAPTKEALSESLSRPPWTPDHTISRGFFVRVDTRWLWLEVTGQIDGGAEGSHIPSISY